MLAVTCDPINSRFLFCTSVILEGFLFCFVFVNMFNHPLVTGIFLLQDTEAYNKSFLNRSLYAVLSLPYGLPGNLLLIALGTFYFLVPVSSHIGLHKAQQLKVAWRRSGERQNKHSLSRDAEAAPAVTAQRDGESELALHWLITTGSPTAAIQKCAWSYTREVRSQGKDPWRKDRCCLIWRGYFYWSR